MLLPMELLDRAILGTLEHDVLQPLTIAKAMEKALQQLQSKSMTKNPTRAARVCGRTWPTSKRNSLGSRQPLRPVA